MAGLDDERFAFYLEHREDIERWAAIRGEVAAAVDVLLEGLSEDVRALAVDLGAECKEVVERAAYPAFQLYRKSWRTGEANPPATIGLAWTRNKTLLVPEAAPYVGVRFEVDDPQIKALRDRFRERFSGQAASDSPTLWWPFIRYIPAEGSFWKDVDPYRAQLVAEFRRAWLDSVEDLEQVLLA